MRIVLSYVMLIVLFTIMIVFAFEFGVRFAFRCRIQTQKYQSIFVHFINYYSPSNCCDLRENAIETKTMQTKTHISQKRHESGGGSAAVAVAVISKNEKQG